MQLQPRCLSSCPVPAPVDPSVTSLPQPCCLCPPREGQPRLSPSALASPSVSTVGSRRTRGAGFGSLHLLSRGLVLQHRCHHPLRTLSISLRHVPELWGWLPALHLGHVPALASPQSPAVPPPLAAPRGEGDPCLQLLPAGSPPLLPADPTPGTSAQRETEGVVMAWVEQQTQVYS